MEFRHLFEANNLAQAMLVEVNAMLIERGLLLSKGRLVDVTLIAAPSSTKALEHARDPETHQTKKGTTRIDPLDPAIRRPRRPRASPACGSHRRAQAVAKSGFTVGREACAAARQRMEITIFGCRYRPGEFVEFMRLQRLD